MKAVIFDMDGLMIDSERLALKCYQKVLGTMGLTMSEDFYKGVLGLPDRDVKTVFLKEYGDNFPFDDVLEKTFAKMREEIDTHGVPLKKGLIPLLTYLQDHHYKTIVATSSPRAWMQHLLEKDVLPYMTDSICVEEVTKGKPDPEMFLKACEKLNVQPADALVLEDSEAGIQAAYNAHIPVIGIPDLKVPGKRYQEMTTYMVASLNDVIALIESKKV